MNEKQAKYAKMALICGAVQILCGILILIISLTDTKDDDTYSIISGVIFIFVGIIYVALNRLSLRQK